MKFVSFRTGPIAVNTYLIANEELKKGFVIDPGGNFKRIMKEAENLGVELKAALLTHGHYDHAGAVAELSKAGVQIYIHSLDADMLYTDKNLAKAMGREFESCRADFEFKDGDVLDICGFKVEVIHTPGHTAGSCTFKLFNMLFTGDTLFFMDVGRTDFPSGDEETLQNSIKNKLFILKGDYKVYPGHGEFTTLDYERANNPYLE